MRISFIAAALLALSLAPPVHRPAIGAGHTAPRHQESAQPGFPLLSRVAIDAASAARLDLLLSGGLDLTAWNAEGRLEGLLRPADIAWVRGLGFELEIVTGDVYADFYRRHGAILGNNLSDYSDYQQNVDELLAMEAAHPAIARTEVVGVSLEGRGIYGLKISDSVDTDEPEPEVLLMAIHHAREPVSNETVLELARRLLGGYGSDPELTFLVDHREIWIIPVVNPDGYVYVDDYDPMWRKNRRGGYGVDINRNYGFQWGYDNWGSSPYTGDETYRGAYAWSEPETQTIHNFINAHQVSYALSFHTYGDLYLYPWGYYYGTTPDNSHFRDIAQVMSQDNHYTYGPTSSTLYLVNGECTDWLYGEQSNNDKIFGYTVEIGDWFWPSLWQIAGLVEENMEPTFYFIEQAGGLHDGDIPLELLNTPATIDRGGPVSWDAHVVSVAGEDLQVDSWIDVTSPVLPPQGVRRVLVRDMLIPAGYDDTLVVSGMMPGNAPLGSYTFRQRIGDLTTGEIYGEDSFTATVN